MNRKVINKYLIYLGKSIQVDFEPYIKGDCDLIDCEGWGASRGKMSWDQRVAAWNKRDTKWLNPDTDFISKEYSISACVPVFGQLMNKAEADCSVSDVLSHNRDINQIYHYPDSIGYHKSKAPSANNQKFLGSWVKNNTINIKQEENTMQKLFNKALEVNKSADKQAAQLSVGKTGNQLVLGKLMGKLPWYAKLFSNKKDLKNNPVAKLVTANVAAILIEHFAKGNKKMNYLAEAMVQDAVMDISYNSDMLETLLKDVESMIDFPDLSGLGEHV